MSKLKKDIDLDTLGVKITEMRHTKSGAVSMADGKGAETALAAEKLKVAVEAILGSYSGVQLHSNLLRL